ncbi:MAG: 6-phosphofructokinase [Verrucomicrobia bacterium]|nr:6-phosphofructokinase [Verrucomicrobiota bacterium]
MKNPDTKRIGVLTSGGDCPGLNAVIRGVVRAAAERGWESIGFSDGYEGLLAPVRYRKLDPNGIDGIMPLGGTILGTTNRGRFAAKVGEGKKASIPKAILAEARETFEGLGLHALVCIGGDGSLSTALQLQKAGMPVVGVPKTIDNDLNATATTFGFDSAVEVVVDALDRLHTTAKSHKRLMVVEVMGRHAGWIALHGGLGGGADVVLIPEIPYHMDKLVQFVKNRTHDGFGSTMVVVAEGAKESGKSVSTKQAKLRTKGEVRLGGLGERLAEELEAATGQEARSVSLGHLQRGGTPSALDRILATRFGVGAVRLIEQRKFGHMVSYQNYHVGGVPIAKAVGTLKTVDPAGETVSAARSVGISFGDR